MKEKGWRPFWAALLAALLVLLPLVGGTVLLTRRSLRTRLASRPQSGVAIRQPKEENRLSLLVCIAPTETTAPGFLLLYLNASQNCIHALALPGELTVPFGADETALSDCYRAAGPARCREALLSALSLPEDTHYLALAPSVLQAIADRVVVGRGHEVFRAFGPFEAMGKAVRAGVAVAAGCLTAVQPLVGTGRAEVEPEVLPLFPAGGIIEFHSISLLFCIKVPPSGHALCSFLEAVFVSGVRRMARIFTRRQGDFPQQSLVDCKGKQRSIRIKRPLSRCAMLTKTASQGGTR